MGQILGYSGHEFAVGEIGQVFVDHIGGLDQAVDELVAWLHDGPRMATVSAVSESETDASAPDRFSTG